MVCLQSCLPFESIFNFTHYFLDKSFPLSGQWYGNHTTLTSFFCPRWKEQDSHVRAYQEPQRSTGRDWRDPGVKDLWLCGSVVSCSSPLILFSLVQITTARLIMALFLHLTQDSSDELRQTPGTSSQAYGTAFVWEVLSYLVAFRGTGTL